MVSQDDAHCVNGGKKKGRLHAITGKTIALNLAKHNTKNRGSPYINLNILF